MGKFRLTRGLSVTATMSEIVENLKKIGIEDGEAQAECRIMFEFVTDASFAQLLGGSSYVLSEEQLTKLDSIIGQRARRVPIQYIIGEVYFCGLKLKVRPGVFIARPDTESLVEVAIENLRALFDSRPIAILEIGVGTGAIAISLLKKLTNVTVTALDVSADALAVTRENAEAHQVENRLTLIRESKWWTIADRVEQFDKYSVLISNPPYIPVGQRPTLQPEVGLYEPEAALFGSDEDGLGFYRQIAKHARDLLSSPALVAVEVGDGQAGAVRNIFSDAQFGHLSIHNDLNGMARVVVARHR